MADTESNPQSESHPPRSGGSVLSKKVGPFSIGVWGALIASGLVIGTFLRSRQKAAPAAATDAPSPDPTGTVTQYDGAAGVLPGASTEPTTNLQWQRKAILALIAQGQDPASVQTAIGKWFNSTPLTAQERAIVSLAISLIGPPPEGAPPIIDAPAAAPSTPTTPLPPGTTPTTGAPGGAYVPADFYPGQSNLVVIETANDMLYKPHAEADFSALRDTLAVRMRDGQLCGNDPAWHESQNPQAPKLAISEHVGARMAQLGFHGKC